MSQVEINDSNVNWYARLIKESGLEYLHFISDLVYFNSTILYNFSKSVTLPGVIRFTKKRDTVILCEEVPIRDVAFLKLLVTSLKMN